LSFKSSSLLGIDSRLIDSFAISSNLSISSISSGIIKTSLGLNLAAYKIGLLGFYS